MPTFPTYHGPPLPNQLHPFDPHHWWLLLTWVFFYPSRLKHYLYRADPNLYTKQGMAEFSMIFQKPAYRSLLVTAILTTAVSLFTLWGTAALWGTILWGFEISWRYIIIAVAVGVAGVVLIGVAGVLTGALMGGVAGDTMGAVVGGVVAGLGGGMVVGV